MCLLILLRGLDPDYPILVANNRDEARARRAAPPGLFVGQRHRMISPRDRQAGGTWSAVSDHGMFAGLTNFAPDTAGEGEFSTRGELPHLALDQADVESAVAAVADAARARRFHQPYRNFQLAVCSADGMAVVQHRAGTVSTIEVEESVLVISNEHPPGALHPEGLDAAAEPGLDLEERWDRLTAILTDATERDGHRILKKGGDYGTVSASLIGVPADPKELVWRYAAGEPDEAEFRNYGNLGRRLQG